MNGLVRVPFDVLPDHVLTPRAADMARRCDARLEELLADGLRERLPCFAPADPVVVDATLAALAALLPRRSLFLEWGSALGTVSALAALRGLRAHGIEILPELVDAARETLAECDIDVEIAQGSFVPDGFAPDPGTHEEDTNTIAEGADAYDLLDRDLDEFDAVYAFPWPGTAPFYADLFARCASPHALLLLHSDRDGISVWRRATSLSG